MANNPFAWVEAAQLRGDYGRIRTLLAFARAALKNDGEPETDEEVAEIEAVLEMVG